MTDPGKSSTNGIHEIEEYVTKDGHLNNMKRVKDHQERMGSDLKSNNI